MNKGLTATLALGNAALFAGLVYQINLRQAEAASAGTATIVSKTQAVLPEDSKTTTSPVKSKADREKERRERLRSNYVLAPAGIDNPVTNIIDGTIMSRMGRGLAITDSFNQLFKDTPEEEKEQLRERRKKFNEILEEYFGKLYYVQRGMDKEGSLDEYHANMKSRLALEAGIGEVQFAELIDIEKKRKR